MATFIQTMIKKMAEGIKGKTTTMHFKPVMKTGQRCLATRPCANMECSCKHGVVFRAEEDSNMYAIVCPSCKGTTWVNPNGLPDRNVDDQCKAIKKDGNRCLNKAKDGGYCGVHSKKSTVADHI